MAISQCDCCPTVVEYIRQHLDLAGLTRSDEDPAKVLDLFDRCFEGGSGVTLDDVKEYLDALREEGK